MPRMHAPTAVARTMTLAAATAAVALPTLPAHAQDAVQWRVEDGGNGHWYQRFTLDDEKSFEEARQLAVAIGADLASVASVDEDEFVSALAGGAIGRGVIIGTKVTDPDCNVFTWTDGSAWTYENWGPNQPDCFFGESIGYEEDGWHDLGWFDIDAAMFEWSADCNGDGIVDYGQILDGSCRDDDGNGIPDPCQMAGDDDAIIDVPSDASTIQEAVDLAPDGGVVRVAGGRFTGDGATVVSIVGRSITIVGSDNAKNPTIVDGQDSRRVFSIEAESAVTIVRISIENGFLTTAGSIGGAGIWCSQSTLDIIDSNIRFCSIDRVGTGYHDAWGAGIFGPSSVLAIEGTTISDNTITVRTATAPGGGIQGAALGGGIAVLNGSVDMEGCWIGRNEIFSTTSVSGWHNVIAFGGGAYFQDTTTTIRQSSIISNRSEVLNESSSVAAVIARAGGIWMMGSGTKSIEGTRFFDNRTISRSSTTYESQGYNSTYSGGLQAAGPEVSIVDCVFEANRVEGGLHQPARNAGGGAWIAGFEDEGVRSRVLVADTIFLDNTVDPPASSGGRIGADLGFDGLHDSIRVEGCRMARSITVNHSVLHNWNIDPTVFDIDDVAICGSSSPLGGDFAGVDGFDLGSDCGDCNGNGILDMLEILDGSLADDDGNGVPDCCLCPGDFNDDGLVDAEDLGLMLSAWGTDGGELPAADLDGDGDVRAGDLGLLLSLWGACDEPDCP